MMIIAINFSRIKSKEAAEWCASQGLDITDIAVQWSLALEQIPTTLISTANPENMRRSVLTLIILA